MEKVDKSIFEQIILRNTCKILNPQQKHLKKKTRKIKISQIFPWSSMKHIDNFLCKKRFAKFVTYS